MADDALTWPDRFARNVQIVEMYGEGYPLRDIGAEFAMSHPGVLAVLEGAGVERRSKSTRLNALPVAKQLRKLEGRYRRAKAKILRTSSPRPSDE